MVVHKGLLNRLHHRKEPTTNALKLTTIKICDSNMNLGV